MHYDLNVKLKTHCGSLTLPHVSLLFFINGLAAASSKLGLGLSQSLRNSHQEPCPVPHLCQTWELPSFSCRLACPGARGTHWLVCRVGGISSLELRWGWAGITSQPAPSLQHGCTYHQYVECDRRVLRVQGESWAWGPGSLGSDPLCYSWQRASGCPICKVGGGWHLA